MKQISLANSGFELTMMRTGKRVFLDEMNLQVQWGELAALIAPYDLRLPHGPPVPHAR